MKKKIIGAAQLAVGIGLIVYIFLRLHRSGELLKLVESLQAAARNWHFVLLGLLSFSVCLFLCTLRWQILLQAQGVKLPFRRVSVLFFIGQFFNAFLFGVTGGDFVKAYYVAAETHHKKTEVVATVFIDRLIGLLALIGLTIVVMAVRLRFFLQWPQTRLAMVFNLGLLIAASAGLFVVFRQNMFERWPLFRRLEQRTSLGAMIGKAYNAFHICLRHPGLLTRTVLLSLANHTFFIVLPFLFGLALNVDLGYIAYLSVFPIINAVGAMPITPGGLGTRESAAILLLGVLGVSEPQAVTISLFVYMTMLTWSLAGGVVYFLYSWKRGKAPIENGAQDLTPARAGLQPPAPANRDPGRP